MKELILIIFAVLAFMIMIKLSEVLADYIILKSNITDNYRNQLGALIFFVLIACVVVSSLFILP